MQVHLAGIGIEHRRELIAGLQILVVHLGVTVHRVHLLLMLLGLIFGQEPFRSVKPVLRRHVCHPRMVETAMIENHVHHHPQSL